MDFLLNFESLQFLSFLSSLQFLNTNQPPDLNPRSFPRHLATCAASTSSATAQPAALDAALLRMDLPASRFVESNGVSLKHGFPSLQMNGLNTWWTRGFWAQISNVCWSNSCDPGILVIWWLVCLPHFSFAFIFHFSSTRSVWRPERHPYLQSHPPNAQKTTSTRRVRHVTFSTGSCFQAAFQL